MQGINGGPNQNNSVLVKRTIEEAETTDLNESTNTKTPLPEEKKSKLFHKEESTDLSNVEINFEKNSLSVDLKDIIPLSKSVLGFGLVEDQEMGEQKDQEQKILPSNSIEIIDKKEDTKSTLDISNTLPGEFPTINTEVIDSSKIEENSLQSDLESELSKHSISPKDIIAAPTKEHMDTISLALKTFEESSQESSDFESLLDSAPGDSPGEKQANFIHTLTILGSKDQKEHVCSLLEKNAFAKVFKNRVRDGEMHEQIITSNTVAAALKDLRKEIIHSKDKEGNPITLMRLHRLTLTETRDMTWKGLSEDGFQNNHISSAWKGISGRKEKPQQGKGNAEFHELLENAFNESKSTRELADRIFIVNRDFSENKAGFKGILPKDRKKSNVYVSSDDKKYKPSQDKHHEILSDVVHWKRSIVLNRLQGVRDVFDSDENYQGPTLAPLSPDRYSSDLTEISTPLFIEKMYPSSPIISSETEIQEDPLE